MFFCLWFEFTLDAHCVAGVVALIALQQKITSRVQFGCGKAKVSESVHFHARVAVKSTKSSKIIGINSAIECTKKR